MKNIILISLVISLLTCSHFKLSANDAEEKSLVYIRIEEAIYKKDSWMKIVENGESTLIQLSGFNQDKDKTINQKTIAAKLKEYLDQGYEIKSSTAFFLPNIGVTNYILVK